MYVCSMYLVCCHRQLDLIIMYTNQTIIFAFICNNTSSIIKYIIISMQVIIIYILQMNKLIIIIHILYIFYFTLTSFLSPIYDVTLYTHMYISKYICLSLFDSNSNSNSISLYIFVREYHFNYRIN